MMVPEGIERAGDAKARFDADRESDLSIAQVEQLPGGEVPLSPPIVRD
jgi:hypothetical protein